MQMKFAINIACIVTVYLAFNLPVLIITAFHQIIHIDIDTYNFYSWAETAAFLSSSVNPVICVWRVKAIWKAIKELWTRRNNRTVEYLSSSLELPSNDLPLISFRQLQEPQRVFVRVLNEQRVLNEPAGKKTFVWLLWYHMLRKTD